MQTAFLVGILTITVTFSIDLSVVCKQPYHLTYHDLVLLLICFCGPDQTFFSPLNNISCSWRLEWENSYIMLHECAKTRKKLRKYRTGCENKFGLWEVIIAAMKNILGIFICCEFCFQSLQLL